jgi:hypothetical protein
LGRHRDGKGKIIIVVNQTVILEALTHGLEQANYSVSRDFVVLLNKPKLF